MVHGLANGKIYRKPRSPCFHQQLKSFPLEFSIHHFLWVKNMLDPYEPTRFGIYHQLFQENWGRFFNIGLIINGQSASLIVLERTFLTWCQRCQRMQMSCSLRKPWIRGWRMELPSLISRCKSQLDRKHVSRSRIREPNPIGENQNSGLSKLHHVIPCGICSLSWA